MNKVIGSKLQWWELWLHIIRSWVYYWILTYSLKTIRGLIYFFFFWKASLKTSNWVVWVCAQFYPTPWTVAHQAPLSMEFPRQEYWSVLPFPSPGDLPDPGIELKSLYYSWSFLPCHLGSPQIGLVCNNYIDLNKREHIKNISLLVWLVTWGLRKKRKEILESLLRIQL